MRNIRTRGRNNLSTAVDNVLRWWFPIEADVLRCEKRDSRKSVRNILPNFFLCKGENEKARLYVTNLTNS